MQLQAAEERKVAKKAKKQELIREIYEVANNTRFPIKNEL